MRYEEESMVSVSFFFQIVERAEQVQHPVVIGSYTFYMRVSI